MNRLLGMATFIAVLMFAVPANAVNGRIAPNGWPVSKVPIFFSEDAIDLATAAFERGSVAGGFLYSSCIVNKGTRAKRLSGWLTYKVVIQSGPQAGCVGYVPTNFFKLD